MIRRSTQKNRRRRGAAAVEFAVMAPLFLAIMMGVSKASHLFELQNQLALAAREGARLAAMERTGLLAEGQTTNEKIADDVRNFLTANGLPGDAAEVAIGHAYNPRKPFNLDDRANDSKLFELRVDLPYHAVSGYGKSPLSELTLSAQVVFRNSRAVIIQ